MTVSIKRKARELSPDQAGRVEKIIRKEVFGARTAAREIVESAEARAKKLIEDAEAREKEIVQAAINQGYREGLSNWMQAIDDYREREQERLRELEPELVKLAIQIAEKIIGREIKTDPELLEGMALKALRSMPRGTDVSIRVHPDNVERTEKMVASRVFRCEVDVIPDDSLGPADYRLESESGSIDGRLEIALETIEEALLGKAGSK